MSKDIAATGGDIENLFRDLLARVGGRGFLSVKREDDGTVVTLVPANPRAARIEAYVEDDGGIVSVEIGKKLIIEVLGSASQPLLSSLRTICEAVLAGKVEEDVWDVESVTAGLEEHSPCGRALRAIFTTSRTLQKQGIKPRSKAEPISQGHAGRAPSFACVGVDCRFQPSEGMIESVPPGSWR
jgi:hypothetical protein